jgi:hypothetical protein
MIRSVLYVTAIVIIQVFVALAVYRDSQRLEVQKRLFLLPPFIWLLIVIIIPFWGVLGYWLIHHSGISSKKGNDL